MITEDELRDRLHAESVRLMPRGDLLKTVAEGHARRHKRARAGLVGGSIAATALVVALLGGLFTSSTPLPIESASPGQAAIVRKAKQATAAANNMIMHVTTNNMIAQFTPGTTEGHSVESPTVSTAASWALRSEKLARISWPDKFDRIVRPGYKEEIDYPARTVGFFDGYRLGDDVVAEVSGSGVGDPNSWFDQITEVRPNDGGIHLIGVRRGLRVEIWLDARTYLPNRAVFGNYTMAIDWLPATAENRKLLEHTIPDGFARKPGESLGGGAIPTLPTN
ncbi:hypothetical protein JOF56_000974 [Kibdelosporangium banguiense]|uniref:Uncharacterized protein n=1 Tax=Kibdelosporangium banguiense TaxID=1365924 RepID=A0ABS4T9H9_9PSEU|nr:hypothetical protein [Kibdelosporangium banguiense]MBP2320589.1 hypothetical protein [Kibdelosporangium banguiense]